MTIRPVLIKEDRYNGNYPIKICVTIKGVRAYYSVGIKVKTDQWNDEDCVVRRNNPSYTIHNRKIQNKIDQAHDFINDTAKKGKPISSSLVVRHLRGGSENDSVYHYIEKYISDFGGTLKGNTLRQYQSFLDKLKAYQERLYFSEVDHTWLRKYLQHLSKSPNLNLFKRDEHVPLANNTIHRHWVFLKKFFNSAIKDGITENYPFRTFDNSPKYKQTIRTFLLIEEVDKIEGLLNKPLDEGMRIVINYFLLGCYSSLRYSDLEMFNYDNFVQGNRLILRATKNGEIISMEINNRLRSVLERLKSLPKVYSEQKCNEYLKSVAKLAGIKKHITTHVARHSFCTHCLRLKVDDRTIAKRMGITLKTLETYKHLLDADVDEEMRVWDEWDKKNKTI